MLLDGKPISIRQANRFIKTMPLELMSCVPLDLLIGRFNLGMFPGEILIRVLDCVWIGRGSVLMVICIHLCCMQYMVAMLLRQVVYPIWNVCL